MNNRKPKLEDVLRRNGIASRLPAVIAPLLTPISVDEVLRLTGIVSRSALYAMVARRTVPCKKLGAHRCARLIFYKEEITEWQARRTMSHKSVSVEEALANGSFSRGDSGRD